MKQIWNKKSINSHFSHLTKEELLDVILGLKSEGKNVINILNQKMLSKRLKGKFVGDIEDNYDIVANSLNIELKCNVNQATDLGKTLGFGEFIQKEGWDYLIHFTPKSFNSYLDEDVFVVFSKNDLPKLKKYCNNSNSIRWTHKIFNPSHTITNVGGKKEKLEFIRSKIMNFDELMDLIWKNK